MIRQRNQINGLELTDSKLQTTPEEGDKEMILTVQELFDRHERYDKDNLSFDYMTPEQFDKEVGSGEELYGEINLRKPYNKEYSTETDWEAFDVINIPDKKGIYFRRFKVGKAKKSHKKTAFGYIAINIQKTTRYIRVMDNKDMLVPLLLLCGAVAVIGLLAEPKFHNTGTQVAESQPQLEVAQGKEWNGELPERYQEEIDNNETVEIAGYTSLLVTADHKQIELINTDGNTVYQQYLIYLDDKELFDSKLIAPGEMVEWNAYDSLDAGHYQLSFKTNTFDVETQAPCNGANQSVSLDVKKS